MWKIILILSILSLCHGSELRTKFTNIYVADVHPCDQLEEGQDFASNPRGCRWWFWCSPDGPVEGHCDAGRFFDQRTQLCDLAESVDCTFDEKLWSTQCPPNGVALIAHPYSCSKYTICLDGKPQDRECDKGLHFSPYEQACISPNYVLCETDNRTCADAPNPFVQQYIPSSRDCEVYYVCFREELLSWRCARGQHFSPTLNQCVPEQSANCQLDNPLPNLPEIPKTLYIDCTNFVNGSRVPHEESCSFWFFCINNQSQLFWCGEGAIFDVNTRSCTSPEFGTCILDVPPVTVTEEEIQAFNEIEDEIANEIEAEIQGEFYEIHEEFYNTETRETKEEFKRIMY